MIKRISFLASFLLLCCQCILAQSYNPFPGEHTYVFGLGSQLDSSVHVLRVDTHFVQNQDTIYEFNRTTHMLNPLLRGYQMGQENIFGSMMIEKPGGIFQFISETLDTFEIKVMEPVGNSWVFSASVMATMQSRNLEPVFSTMDTVLTISLSSGSSIRLSETYGLLDATGLVLVDSSFSVSPNFHLVGVEELGLGVSRPQFEDFFDIEVGAYFQYNWNFQNGMYYWDEREDYLIDSKNTVGSVTEFQYAGLKQLVSFIPNPPIGIDTNYSNTPSFAKNYHEDDFKFLEFLSGEEDSMRILRKIRIDAVDSRWVYEIENYLKLAYDSVSNAYHEFEQAEIWHYKPDLGCIYYTTYKFDNSETKFLSCYQFKNESWGTCDNLSVFNAIEDPDILKVKIWPNPVAHTLRLDVGEHIGLSSAVIRVFNIEGALMYEGAESIDRGVYEFDVRAWPSGVYLLNYQDEEGHFLIRKVLKKR